MSYKVGDKYVINCPVDPRNAQDGYGPNYENGVVVTVVERSRKRAPVLEQAGISTDGKPDPSLPKMVHVWVKSDEAETPIWAQPSRLLPHVEPAKGKPGS